MSPASSSDDFPTPEAPYSKTTPRDGPVSSSKSCFVAVLRDDVNEPLPDEHARATTLIARMGRRADGEDVDGSDALPQGSSSVKSHKSARSCRNSNTRAHGRDRPLWA